MAGDAPQNKYTPPEDHSTAVGFGIVMISVVILTSSKLMSEDPQIRLAVSSNKQIILSKESELRFLALGSRRSVLLT